MRPPCRILYVDDDKDSCELARFILSSSDVDCTFISAESAEEALSLIEKESFDLYIFDYWMPEISGVELCSRVRLFDSNTPILFFSAMARPVDIADGIEAGANEYLVKPNDLDKLSTTVKRFLDERLLARSPQFIINSRINLSLSASSEQVLQPTKLQPLIWKDLFQKSIVNSLKTQCKRFRNINNQIGEKKFNQNKIQTDEASKLRIQPLLTGAAIFAVFVIHFVSQFTFFQNENLLSTQNSPKIENAQNVENEIQYEAKSLDIEMIREKVKPSIPSKIKITLLPRVIKKQKFRESKAERLRRAERILTGI